MDQSETKLCVATCAARTVNRLVGRAAVLAGLNVAYACESGQHTVPGFSDGAWPDPYFFQHGFVAKAMGTIFDLGSVSVANWSARLCRTAC